MESEPPVVERIVLTKLYRQRPPADSVPRPALVARLNDYLPHRVVLVHAPAGYGKTTLVSEWLESVEDPVAWLSLDEYDGDPKTFIGYLLAAVAMAYPQVGEDTRALLQSPQNVATNVLADTLISELEDLPDPLVVVLDDYHLIDQSPAAAVVERLVTYLPEPICLVLTCRARPNLPLVKLRLRDQLGEIAAEDLAFSEDEAAALVSRLAGRPVSETTINLLEQQTEGWVTALTLAGLSLRERTEAELNRVLGTQGSTEVFRYLSREVSQLIPAEMLDFLLKTSIVDAFSAELCSAILDGYGVDRTRLMLNEIEQANLFLISVDEQGDWFRYHHLFRDNLVRALGERFQPEQIAELRWRASVWFEDKGMISEAIRQLLAAGDEEGAARIAERHYDDVLNAEDWNRLQNWLGLVPQTVMSRPGILIIRAWLEHFGWRFFAAAELARAAEAALDGPDHGLSERECDRLRGDAAVLRAQAAQWTSDPAAPKIAADALARLAADRVFVRSLAELYVILSTQQIGEGPQAVAYAEKRLAEVHQRSDSLTFRLLLALCAAQIFEGNLDALHSTASTFSELTERAGNRFSLAWALLLLGLVAYERNRLDEAEEQFSAALHLRYQANAKTAADSYLGLVLTLMSAGRLEEAEEALQRFREFLAEGGILTFASIVESLGHRLALAQYAAAAEATAPPAQYVPPQTVFSKLCVLEVSHLTAVRSLLARGTPADLAQAGQYLDAVREQVVLSNERRRYVELNTLAALIRAATGDEEGALEALEAAVVQGEQGGYVRSIVDAGDGLVPLLMTLRERGAHTAYIDHLLAVLQDSSGAHGAALAILLTNREMEVLEFLAQRKSNKEIAAVLYLSPLTIKRHTQSLFRKLGATSRREAVVLARQRGLNI